MRLTSEQANAVIARLNSTAANRQPCPICGGTHWNLNDKIFEVREFQGGSLVLGGDTSVLPVIAMSCQNCGYTHFINAIKIGAVNPAPSPAGNQPETPQENSQNANTTNENQ